MTRLYIGHLAYDTTEDMIRSFLEQDGRTVTQVMVKKKGATGKPRGFAFADMGSQLDMERAIELLNGATLNGRAVKVGPAKALPNRTGASTEPSGRPYGNSRGGNKGRRN